jgi:hypothetical protein
MKKPVLLNWIAGGAHLLIFATVLVLTIIYWNSSLVVQITADWRKYDPTPPGPPESGDFSTEIYSLGYYRLLPVLLPFPLLTALMHFLLASVLRKRYYKSVSDACNYFRWLEYSVTASFMTWVLMQLVGITNIFHLLVIGVIGNVALQFCGYAMEKMNPMGMTGSINWWPTYVGWFIFLGQWSMIATYFFEAVASSATAVPWFVYATFIGEFINFSLFGLLQILHFMQVKFWRFDITAYSSMEFYYILLSFFAKTYLALILAIGIAAR